MSERIANLGHTTVAKWTFHLLHDAIYWLEQASLDPQWDAILEAVKSDPRVVNDWREKRALWQEKWYAALKEHLPESLKFFDNLMHGVDLEYLLLLRHDLVMYLKSLGQAFLSEQKRLTMILAVLKTGRTETSISHVPGETFMGKVQYTMIGLVTGMVIPVPGSLEAWAVSSAMMWLSDDMRFLLLKDRNLQSLRARCPAQTFKDHEDAVNAFTQEKQRRRILVWNQTSRCFNLRFEAKDGIVEKTVGVVMAAHPMSKMVLDGITAKSREQDDIIWPGQLLCLDVPLVPKKKKKKDAAADPSSSTSLPAALTNGTQSEPLEKGSAQKENAEKDTPDKDAADKNTAEKEAKKEQLEKEKAEAAKNPFDPSYRGGAESPELQTAREAPDEFTNN